MTYTYKYIISAMLLAAATTAAADGFTGLGGEKDGMIWTLDAAVSGRYVGTGMVLSQGADITSWTAASGIESVAADRVGKLTVYPNPVTDYLHIAGADDCACWSIITLDGRTASKGTVTDNTIDCTKLAAGRYIVTVTDGRGSKPYSSIIIKK